MEAISSLMENLDPKTFWIIWFLCSVLLCECSPVPHPDPPMSDVNLQQQWELRVPEGFQIQLTSTNLGMEAAAGCYYDSLTVLYKEKLLGKFSCSENSTQGHHLGNPPIRSPGNTLTLIFQINGNNSERYQNLDFSARYQAIDIDECSEPLDGSGPLCSQICLNTPGSYLCDCHHGFELRSDQRTCVFKVCPAVVTSHSMATPQRAEHHQGQTVMVACDVGYVVNSQGVPTLTSQFEATCDITGTWTPGYTCEPVDCGFPDIPADGILQLVGSEPPHTRYKDQVQFNCSSKYYRLDGNDTYTCNASGEWMSADGTTELPECTAVCGQPESFFASAGRILGGQNAKLGEIPWQLQIKSPHRGGASLIGDRWAVTAASLVNGLPETSLHLYGGLVDARTSSGRGVAVLNSERIIIHPGYGNETHTQRTNYDNDIALIRFSSRVNLGPNLQPICLPEPNRGVWENELGTVSGWGMTESRHISALLKYTHISAYSLEECQRTPTISSNEAMIFTNNMSCAGAPGKDSCQGDSGGPFVLPMLSSDGGPYVVAGIVSWGAPCRSGDNKGYYTKVENYVEWIKHTMTTEDGN